MRFVNMPLLSYAGAAIVITQAVDSWVGADCSGRCLEKLSGPLVVKLMPLRRCTSFHVVAFSRDTPATIREIWFPVAFCRLQTHESSSSPPPLHNSGQSCRPPASHSRPPTPPARHAIVQEPAERLRRQPRPVRRPRRRQQRVCHRRVQRIRVGADAHPVDDHIPV